jgi:NAD(P)-dependent dehydrogenase (short-subunit alcohol dehydrogenase family)
MATELPDPRLRNGKVAIITGASQGIGAGLTRAYRELGYEVVATARSIECSDPGIVAVPGDIADPDTAERVIDVAVGRFGRIDTLINNAGIYIGKPFIDYTLEDFNSLIAVNLAGFFHITTRAIPHLLDHGAGHIVNVSTTLAEYAESATPAALQALTKGGLVAVTRSLAIEYASRGLRVNAVSLGVIETQLHEESAYAGMGALHPLGRIGEIEDVVGGILYLESAPFVTGETLHIDGGQGAGH